MIKKRAMILMISFISLVTIVDVLKTNYPNSPLINHVAQFLTIHSAIASVPTDKTHMVLRLDLPIYGREKEYLFLKNYRGKIVFVHFFAPWCSHCRDEHAEIVKIAKIPNLVVIGISIQNSKDELEKFLGTGPNPYTIIGIDDYKDSVVSNCVSAVPTSFILDQVGRVVFHHEGVVNKYTIEQEIKKLAPRTVL